MSLEDRNINFNSVLDQAIARQRKLSKTNKLLHLRENQAFLYSDNIALKTSGKALKTFRFHARFKALYGINPTLLIHQVLHWFDPKTKKHFSSPLFCQRIDLHVQKDLEDKLLVKETSSVFVNPVLSRYFKVYFDIELNDSNAKEQIIEACKRNNIKLSEKEEQETWWFSNEKLIGNFDYSSLYFEEDLLQIQHENVKNWTAPNTNPIQFNFVGPYDISQKEFCDSMLNEGPSILQGPPGTGKSQTIVNLISSYASAGKKVLMVSSKKAAIDVVEKKLVEAGLGDLLFKSTQYNDALHQVYKSVVKTVESWENEEEEALKEHNYNAHEELIRAYIYQKSEVIEDLGMSIHQALKLVESQSPQVIDRYLPSLKQWQLIKPSLEIWIERFDSICWIALAKHTLDHDQPIDNWLSKVETLYNNQEIIEKLKSFNDANDLTLENLQKYNVLAQALSNIPIKTLSFVLNNKSKRNQLAAAIRKLNALDVYESEDQQFFNAWSSFPTKEEVDFIIPKIAAYKNSNSFTLRKLGNKKAIDRFMSRYSKKNIDWNSLVRRIEEWYKRDDERKAIFAKQIDALQIDLSEKAMVIQLGHLLEQLDQNVQFYEQIRSSNNVAEILKNLQEQSGIVEQFKHALRFLFINPYEISITDVLQWASWVFNHKKFILENKQSLLKILSDLTIPEKKALIGIYGEDTDQKIQVNSLALALEDRPILKKYDDQWLISRLSTLTKDKQNSAKINAVNIVSRYKNQVIANEKLILLRASTLNDAEKKLKQSLKAEKKVFIKEVYKKRQHIGIKQLIKEAPEYFFQYKPIHLLSPQVVASSIPCISNLYDIVIFDESSQLHLDESLSSIFRSKNYVVVGDPQQMPPSMWFEKQEDQIESLLDYTLPRLPKKTLQWHYRSKSPSLISFSNKYFYGNQLECFPSSSDLHSFEYLNVEGHYENGINKIEVQTVISIIKQKQKANADKQIGVIALSSSQAEAITKEVYGEQLNNVEVYNLENAQGDEQDIIILSLGYGAKGKEALNKNFGPINQAGGPQRLNVLFTRAIEQLVLVTSFEANELMDTTNEGLILLRKYMEFVKAQSEQSQENETKHDISVFELQKDMISYLLGLENRGINFKIKT